MRASVYGDLWRVYMDGECIWMASVYGDLWRVYMDGECIWVAGEEVYSL